MPYYTSNLRKSHWDSRNTLPKMMHKAINFDNTILPFIMLLEKYNLLYSDKLIK